ncbi:SusC/RagA family TonB-linked outer membrane protein [Chryseobacterium sp. NKUCC03_KSP]|uniref:SusC/RagA family TonB-linked outer membrane protein n=1 Tax=Chryseobacterium sp. NKUCC03_KSP TaxID=2842125 RepID=UPI001C5BE98B|nr:SusC/RagA family TonB-linked outer membrane protein [Chryseobacterium sp. NKUCC03_KSP]MBW3523319.1 SusC/RagA family TonB-linked outer membrane protein [Chryseobacterium sp. NKUCC03_KSP]
MKKNFCSLSHLQLAFGFTLLVSGVAIGQMRTITGTVTENNQPLKGVSVFQEGSNEVAVTNASGVYRVQVSGENPVIIYRHSDYPERKITLGSRITVNISLGKEKEIEEVVLNAGYYKVKDKERTGSIAKISAKDIENQPVTNILASAQGRMAGVSITQNSGTAGGGFDVQIRGKNSLRPEGNYPLYIVDGVPLNSQSNALTSLSAGILSKGEASPLNSINPNDIESMEVLKDADATAIYGSRGANGVVIITTKKGSFRKASLEFTMNTTISKVNQFIEMANTSQYLQLRKDAYRNDNISAYPVTAYDVNGKWDQSRETDWYKTFIGNTFLSQQQQLSYSGGNSQNQYHLGIHHQEQGTAFGNGMGYKRSGFNLSNTYSTEDRKLKISPTIYYTVQDNNLNDADLTRQILLAPNAPALYNPNGQLNWENNTFANPLAKLENKYSSKIKTLTSNMNVDYQMFEDWSLKINAGYTLTEQNESRLNPSTAFNPSTGANSSTSVRYDGVVVRDSWIIEPQLHWNKRWNNHKLSALAGMTVEERNDQILRLQGNDFSSNDLIGNLSNAKVQKVLEDNEVQYRYNAFFGRFNYDYSGKYIVNLTARRDGSSRFGPQKRFANFGAVGAAWIFSKESFLENTPWLNFGKLRMSLGTAGSDLIGDYQFMDTYTTTTQIYDGVSGIYPSRLFNPNFSWEKTTKMETALELGLFKDKVNLTVAYYQNRSSNQLVGLPLAATTGFLTVQSNFPAKVQNTGAEAELNVNLIRKKNLRWSVAANLTVPRTKLLEFDNIESTSYATMYEVGSSMNIKKVYELKGVNRDTGVYEFSDLNGDGKIDLNDRTKVVDIGMKFFGGLSSQINYKNWSFAFLIQGVKQRQYSLDYSISLLGIMSNVPSYMLDYWTPENRDARYQRPGTGTNSDVTRAHSLYQSSDAVIVDASFIRLNNVQLSYKIPLKEGLIRDLTLQAQAQNLFAITGYKGLDPEVAGFYLPSIKSYSLSATLKF